MPKKYTRSSGTSLDVRSIPLIITKNDALRAYIQVFTHDPENITQQALGSVFGVFKVRESDPESAFIVNFLVSEFKKEYYANTARPADTSFEAALNRINLALSELAKQGNIGWMGNLEAAVCALDKSRTLHFSTAGNASVVLFRDSRLTVISEGLSPEETNNPLKTFAEISSGKLLAKDKVIITTQELFDVFPERELTRNADRFSPQEFIQCVHTALVNSVPIAGSVVLDVSVKQAVRRKPAERAAQLREDNVPNVFSQQAFREANRMEKNVYAQTKTAQKSESDPEENRIKNHIYIQQKVPFSNAGTSSAKENFLVWKERAANALDTLWESTSKTFQKHWRSLSKTLASRYASLWFRAKNFRPRKVHVDIQEAAPPEPKKESVIIKQKAQLPEKHVPVLESPSTSEFATERAHLLLGQSFDKMRITGTALLRSIKKYSFAAYSFAKRMPSRQRAIAGAVILIVAILAAGIFIARKNKTEVTEVQPETAPQEKTATRIREEDLAKEPGIIFADAQDLTSKYSAQSGSAILGSYALSNGDLAIIEDSQVVVSRSDQSQEAFPLGSALPDFEGVQFASGALMSELQTLFLLTNIGEVVSLSPTTGKFEKTNISVDQDAVADTLIAAYSTYLYVANTKENTILRYPRAEGEGGFGEPITWLSSNSGADLSGATDMSISGSIYLAKKNHTIRLENRKENPLDLKQPIVPADFSLVDASDEDNLYVFDSNEKRVLAYKTADGTLVNQYALPQEFADMTYVSLTHTNDNTLLLSTPEQVLEIQL